MRCSLVVLTFHQSKGRWGKVSPVRLDSVKPPLRPLPCSSHIFAHSPHNFTVDVTTPCAVCLEVWRVVTACLGIGELRRLRWVVRKKHFGFALSHRSARGLQRHQSTAHRKISESA